MPKPATTIAVATYSRDVSASIRAKRTIPIATSTEPATPSILYLAGPRNRLAADDARDDDAQKSGVNRLPDWVADTPRTPCMKSGR